MKDLPRIVRAVPNEMPESSFCLRSDSLVNVMLVHGQYTLDGSNATWKLSSRVQMDWM